MLWCNGWWVQLAKLQAEQLSAKMAAQAQDKLQADTQAELNQARAQLEQTEAELDQMKNKFKEAAKEAEQQLQDAQAELKKAKQQVLSHAD